ncbi:MAG: OmpH family outer membrane protein [Rickettsiales bacterium]|jgi:Skp family chaperone for outer membrane proteins|nr:OmpH family outer membrane protein [Rickettsiales bacterium]
MSKSGKIIVSVVVIAAVAVAGYFIFKPKSDPYKDIDPTSITSQGQINFGTINMVKINDQAKALKELSDQRVAFSEKLNKQAKDQEANLMKEKKDIEAKQSVLAKDVLEKRVMEYQNKVLAFQQDVQEKAQAIEVNYRDALQEVQKDYLDDIISNIAKRKDITIILNTAQIISLNPALDITDDVVSVLDQQLKSKKMKAPKGL